MNGRIVNQLQINFIQMLEREYEVDIKMTADYVEIRKKWIGEGSRVPAPPNVQPRASKVPPCPHVQYIKHWNPRVLPLRWEDLL